MSRGRRFNLKADSYHIEKFRKTGAFPVNAEFFRSERESSEGAKIYWNYICPICSNDDFVKSGICSGIFESATITLKRGHLPCRCSKQYKAPKEIWEHKLKEECKQRGYTFIGWKTKQFGSIKKFIYSCRFHGEKEIRCESFLQGQGCPQCAGQNQQECYINLVQDEDTPIALKFGIANNSKRRVYLQNCRNLFRMDQIHVYKFETVSQCKASERACLQELECGILTARELKDGWTETTSIQNLEKIIEIYERFGGVRIK